MAEEEKNQSVSVVQEYEGGYSSDESIVKIDSSNTKVPGVNLQLNSTPINFVVDQIS